MQGTTVELSICIYIYIYIFVCTSHAEPSYKVCQTVSKVKPFQMVKPFYQILCPPSFGPADKYVFVLDLHVISSH